MLVNESNTNEDVGLPTMPPLYGKDAKAFEEYDKRELTKKEIEMLKEADEFYNAQCSKNQ